MGCYRPLPTVRLTPPYPQSGTKITSAPWNSESFTMRILSTSHPRATLSTMGKYLASTSPLVVDYTKRRSGSISMTMALSQAISAPKAPMSSLILSTSTSPLTTALTHPLQHYLCGSAICSPGQEATSTSSKIRWPRLTIGAWQERSHVTSRLMMTSPTSRSRSRSTNGTSTQHELILRHVSLASCLPVPQSMLKCFITCRGR
jgi:hypothetical protein